MIERNDPCWCSSGLKWKKCHYPVQPYHDFKELVQDYKKRYGIFLKTETQIQGIRRACRLAATILQKTCQQAREGVTTNELNDFAEKLHREAGAKAASLGYGDPPFPKSICTSLNEVICHGIPDDRPLQRGDILNVDVACVLDGYYGDCSAMVVIEPIDEDKRRVVDVSKECLRRSIEILKPGVLISEVGRMIEEYARAHNCSVVNQFVGHGVGLQFHEPPQVPHHFNQLSIPFAEGMTFTIEPMINAGVRSGEIDPIDRWTVRTSDGKPSAQWEHTILITREGHEVLTLA